MADNGIFMLRSLPGSEQRPSELLELAIASLLRARDYLIAAIDDEGLLHFHVQALSEASDLPGLMVVSNMVARAAPLSNQIELAEPAAELGRGATLVFKISARAASAAASAQESRESKAKRLYKKMMNQGPVVGMKVAEGYVDLAILLKGAVAAAQVAFRVSRQIASLAGQERDEIHWESSRLAELGLRFDPAGPLDGS